MSLTPDILDWQKSNFYVTPVSQFADFSLLQLLDTIDLQTSHTINTITNDNIKYYQMTINVTNPSDHIIAFGVNFKILSKNNDFIAPIFWDDNYITLFPEENRVITAEYEYTETNQNVVLNVDSWNNVFGHKKNKNKNI